MSIIVSEIIASPTLSHGANPSADRTIRVFSTDPAGDSFTRASAYATAQAWFAANPVPALSSWLRMKSITENPIGIGDCYEFVAHYDRKNAKIVKFKFNTSGATVKKYYQAVAASAATPGQQAPNMNGGVGWQGDHFEGFDCPVPGGTLSIETCFAWSSMTKAFRDKLFKYRGSVNSGAFFGFAAGEVMFTGADVSNEEEVDESTGNMAQFWRVNFNFQIGVNQKNVDCNGQLGQIDVDAFQPYWVLSVDAADADGKRRVKKPIAHYAHTVPSASFSEFNIPTDLFGPLWTETT